MIPVTSDHFIRVNANQEMVCRSIPWSRCVKLRPGSGDPLITATGGGSDSAVPGPLHVVIGAGTLAAVVLEVAARLLPARMTLEWTTCSFQQV